MAASDLAVTIWDSIALLYKSIFFTVHDDDRYEYGSEGGHNIWKIQNILWIRSKNKYEASKNDYVGECSDSTVVSIIPKEKPWYNNWT